MSTATVTLVLTTTWKGKGTPEEVRAGALDALLGYLGPEGPLAEDFGPEAWGGYEGPFVHGITTVVTSD